NKRSLAVDDQYALSTIDASVYWTFEYHTQSNFNRFSEGGNMRMFFKIVGASLFLLALQAAPANASIINYTATLSGGGENPPNGSPATGFALVTLNDVTDLLTVNETFSGLTAPASAAHIHCCAGPGTNAGVVLNFVGQGFPVGSTSGSFTHTFNLTTDLIGISLSAFLTNLDLGTAYANIHDANFPAGEIRGQLTRVPEPATLLIFCLGVGLLGLVRRKQTA
ncbi:MAG TPA: CHRD domain-containing protein, partial [Steroidobacteraceae bacterium]|nr:CHRD domain-containing protein [Steroidobacteraceae bacterium]